MAIDFGFGDRLRQELYGSGGPLSGGNIPQGSAPSSGSNLSQSEQLQIAQTAIAALTTIGKNTRTYPKTEPWSTSHETNRLSAK